MNKLWKSVFALVFLIATVAVPSASASDVTVDSFPTEFEIREGYEAHLEPTAGGYSLFDAESARASGVDPRIVEIGQLANSMVMEKNRTIGSDTSFAPMDLNPTNYGNWCGEHNSGPGGWDRTYLEAAIVMVPYWHGCRV